MEGEKTDCFSLAFASAAAANRRVAGVAAVARLAREMGDDIQRVRIVMPEGDLDARARTDLARLAPGLDIAVVRESADGFAAPELDARAVLRATGKAGDGIVSRWLNRPVSRFLSLQLLRIPGIRPVHATIGTALLALAMFAALVGGGEAGLIAGGLLFHTASVFDGVDGEIARATYRSSAAGAALDTLVDVATNLLFVLGMTIALAGLGHPAAIPVGAFGFTLFAAGLAAISWRESRSDGPFRTDALKRRDRDRQSGAVRALTGFAIAVSSRDFFALLFALLILARLPMAVLYIFAAAAMVWFPVVILSLLTGTGTRAEERSA